MISLAREYRAKRPKGSLAKSTRTRVRRLLLPFRAKEREIEKERGMIRENRASHESFRRGGGKGGLQPSVSFIEISLFQNYHAFQSFQDESDFFLPLSAPTNARERHPRVICREGVRGVVQAFERASRDSISIKVKKRESAFEGARRALSYRKITFPGNFISRNHRAAVCSLLRRASKPAAIKPEGERRCDGLSAGLPMRCRDMPGISSEVYGASESLPASSFPHSTHCPSLSTYRTELDSAAGNGLDA